jgi:tetratricopeptide (TPR) repeat protein
VQLVVQAKQFMDQRKYPDAIARLNQVLAADPHMEIALRLRYAAYMLSGRIAEGRTDMDEVLKLKPDDSTVLASRAIASIALRQRDKAADDIARALAINPNNEMAYLGRGMINRANGKYNDAVADLDRAIALNPKDNAAYSERGLAYVSLNQLDKALVDFDQAIALNPSNGVARGARGLALLMKGSNEEGLLDIKAALDRDPNNELAQVGQGLAMLVSSQFDRAIVALNQLIGKTVAFDTSARLLRARAYLAKKDPVAAMTDLNLVLGTRPNEPEALQLRGIAFGALRENDKALDDLGRAIAQRETVEGYFARAKIHEAQNDVGKAASDYKRATELAATSVFDRLAQAESKQKVQQLSKRIPCGHSARGSGEGTCL